MISKCASAFAYRCGRTNETKYFLAYMDDLPCTKYLHIAKHIFIYIYLLLVYTKINYFSPA